MNMWERYCQEHCDDTGRHKDFLDWYMSDVWEFERTDGLKTAHHIESPYMFKRETIEASMRLADKHIPLGAELPEGMRSREDPYYGPLFDLSPVSGREEKHTGGHDR